VLRDFINRVQRSYKQNHIYVLRDIEFKRLSDMESSSEKATTSNRRVSRRRSSRRGSRRAVRKKEDVKELEPKKYWESDSYGQAVIGRDNTCSVTLKYDYYIYIGK
jgi:hypothetical protein